MILAIGEYKINCQNDSSDVADHCRQYALSDSKVREYQVIILLGFSYIGLFVNFTSHNQYPPFKKKRYH